MRRREENKARLRPQIEHLQQSQENKVQGDLQYITDRGSELQMRPEHPLNRIHRFQDREQASRGSEFACEGIAETG
jgi:hypothetical protein